MAAGVMSSAALAAEEPALDGNYSYYYYDYDDGYSDAPTAPQNGWFNDDGDWFYYKNGTRHVGWLQEGNTTYWFPTQGSYVTA